MLTTSTVIAFTATADAARARNFYEQLLGLRLLADEPFAVVFDVNGVTLRVQKVQEVRPVPYTALGWAVSDIRSTVHALSGRGIAFERYPGLPQDDLAIWTSPSGARVAWFKDPDGNVLSLTQS